MAKDATSKPSFSPGRRWGICFNVAGLIVAVLAVAVMANYFGGRYYQRCYLSTQTEVELSSQTKRLLRSLTNQVQVILYYDKNDNFFGNISELLDAYCRVTPKISVRLVDYLRDPGTAQQLKEKYSLATFTDKNLVIFDCEGRPKPKIVPGDSLMQTILKQLPGEPGEPGEKPTFYRKPVAFMGEMMFTGALLSVMNPKPLHAYVLQDHGEHILNEEKDELGYKQFVNVLEQNNVQVTPLLLITNPVPADCNMLVVAGPRNAIPPVELERIEQYLNEGGRMFVLFNAASVARETGLEKILAKWGIKVGNGIVKEPRLTTGSDVIVVDFKKSPVVNPLLGSQLRLILPREIGKLGLPAQTADTLKVEAIAFSSPESELYVEGASPVKGSHPLMVTVEKGAVKGIVSERGVTRILVTGDSFFLDNELIDFGANRDFAGYAVNWLLDRSQMLEGPGPKSVVEYRLLIPKSQMRTLRWILLGAIPGGILLFGGLVWLVRRK